MKTHQIKADLKDTEAALEQKAKEAMDHLFGKSKATDASRPLNPTTHEKKSAEEAIKDEPAYLRRTG